jgi:hypothetical protein
VVPRISAELQNIPLRNAHVFQNLPGRMYHFRMDLPSEMDWNIGNRIVEGRMGLSPAQELNQMLSQRSFVIHCSTSF